MVKVCPQNSSAYINKNDKPAAALSNYFSVAANEYKELINIIIKPVKSWDKLNLCKKINQKNAHGKFILTYAQRENLMVKYNEKVKQDIKNNFLSDGRQEYAELMNIFTNSVNIFMD